MANDADAIDLMNENTRLKAEVERLKVELAGSKESLRGHVEGVRSWQERAEKAEAEVAVERSRREAAELDFERMKTRYEAEREQRERWWSS